MKKQPLFKALSIKSLFLCQDWKVALFRILSWIPYSC